MNMNRKRAPSQLDERAAHQPNPRLTRSSFLRLSSGFVVTDPLNDRATMELSDALQARLAGRAQTTLSEGASVSTQASSMSGVIARLRAVAERLETGAPFSAANVELSELIAQLRTGLEVAGGKTSLGNRHSLLEFGPNGAARASISSMHRLAGALARARAIEGNLAGAGSDTEALSRAEEQMVLGRAQALLEEGVARFAQVSTRPRARELLN